MCRTIGAADGHTDEAMPANKPATDAPPTTDLAGDILRVADEIRVRIHLAGMEAKDAWNELEPKLRELEHRAEAATSDVIDELRERMSKLLERVRGH